MVICNAIWRIINPVEINYSDPACEHFELSESAATERRLRTVVVGTVTINFPVREIGSDGLKLADGVPFFLQSSVQGLFEDDEAMKVGIHTFPVDELLHEYFSLFHRVEMPRSRLKTLYEPS